MPNRVHIPGLGDVPRSGLVAGIVVGAGGGVYLWYRHKHASASSAPGTYGYGYGGYGYGGYGYSNPPFNEPYIGGAYGYGGLYGYGIGVGYGAGSPSPSSAPPQLVASNAQWAQAAESYLTQVGQYDPASVATALGVYLHGGTLTAAQQSIVEAAIAFENYPPTPGPNNFPPAMHASPQPGQGGSGNRGGGGSPKPPSPSPGPGPATKVTIPITYGMRAETAIKKIEGAGFTVSTSPARNPQNEYRSRGSVPRGGTKAEHGSHVTLNVIVISPVKR